MAKYRTLAACLLANLLVLTIQVRASDGSLAGQVTDLQGKPVSHALVQVVTDPGSRRQQTESDADGKFAFPQLPIGTWKLSGKAAEFADAFQTISVRDGQTAQVNLQFTELATRIDAITVTADVKEIDIQQPDPAQRVLVREEILDANPGRPGAPVSIPGLPIETASGGIKAPQ